jgi:hypothetical protein
MKITLTRTATGGVELQYDDEALAAPTGELEDFLQDSVMVLKSALLDVQPNLTSETGWQDDD